MWIKSHKCFVFEPTEISENEIAVKCITCGKVAKRVYNIPRDRFYPPPQDYSEETLKSLV